MRSFFWETYLLSSFIMRPTRRSRIKRGTSMQWAIRHLDYSIMSYEKNIELEKSARLFALEICSASEHSSYELFFLFTNFYIFRSFCCLPLRSSVDLLKFSIQHQYSIIALFVSCSISVSFFAEEVECKGVANKHMSILRRILALKKYESWCGKGLFNHHILRYFVFDGGEETQRWQFAPSLWWRNVSMCREKIEEQQEFQL